MLLLSCLVISTTAWSATSFSVLRSCSRQRQRYYLQAQKNDNNNQKDDSSSSSSSTTLELEKEWQDEDAGAGVVGAEFFGGNKQKEEFYDPIAEAEATKLAFESSRSTKSKAIIATSFDRFADRTAFDSNDVASLASAYQKQLNQAVQGKPATQSLWSDNLQWESPFSSTAAATTTSPLTALQEASNFYRRIHVAITAGTTTLSSSENNNNKYKLQWEIGLAWPTFWEPAVLLTGSSTVTVVNGVIMEQVDRLDDADLLGSIARQIVPRFWDVYHIGMTPTAELSPAWEQRRLGFFQDFVLYDVPGRWIWAPSLLDKGSREDANASFLPNHSYTTAIRTMGPKKDPYIPTVPTQIDISPASNGNRVTWKIPLSVEFQSQQEWPLVPNEEEEEDKVDDGTSEAAGSYTWQPARRVATLPTGIVRPQDEGITDLRKRLYDRVTSAGLKPKLDANGRPRFFFWSAATKTCFTDQGLGMTVYEWRPAWAQSNHVGIELEAQPELLAQAK